MNTNQYTQKTLEALQAAQQLAVEYQHNQLEPEHLLHALASQEQGLIPQLLQKLNVDPGSFAAAAAEKPEGQRHHDKAETAQGMHSEAEHVVGVGEVIQIDDERGARGGQAGDAIEDGIEVGHVMPREVQRERGEQRENNPGETGHRQRLTAIEASGFDAQKTQTAARDHGDADCREVARIRRQGTHLSVRVGLIGRRRPGGIFIVIQSTACAPANTGHGCGFFYHHLKGCAIAA